MHSRLFMRFVYIHHLRQPAISIKPAHVSLLSALVRSHETNTTIFKKSEGISLLVNLLEKPEVRACERTMTKLLFFYEVVATAEEISIGLDPVKICELFSDSEGYSTRIVALFEKAGNDWAKHSELCNSRRKILALDQ